MSPDRCRIFIPNACLQYLAKSLDLMLMLLRFFWADLNSFQYPIPVIFLKDTHWATYSELCLWIQVRDLQFFSTWPSSEHRDITSCSVPAIAVRGAVDYSNGQAFIKLWVGNLQYPMLWESCMWSAYGIPLKVFYFRCCSPHSKEPREFRIRWSCEVFAFSRKTFVDQKSERTQYAVCSVEQFSARIVCGCADRTVAEVIEPRDDLQVCESIGLVRLDARIMMH